MKYKTKQQRLMAITDVYCKLHGKTSFTIDEVAEWALARAVWPVPKRGDPEAVRLAWEARLATAEVV